MQEWFQAGVIGQVREVHFWTNRPIWPQGMPDRPKRCPCRTASTGTCGSGPAPVRPFHKTYHPFGWRGW